MNIIFRTVKRINKEVEENEKSVFDCLGQPWNRRTSRC